MGASQAIGSEASIFVCAIETTIYHNRAFPMNAADIAAGRCVSAAPKLMSRVGVKREERPSGSGNEDTSGYYRRGCAMFHFPDLLEPGGSIFCRHHLIPACRAAVGDKEPGFSVCGVSPDGRLSERIASPWSIDRLQRAAHMTGAALTAEILAVQQAQLTIFPNLYRKIGGKAIGDGWQQRGRRAAQIGIAILQRLEVRRCIAIDQARGIGVQF